MMRSTFLHRVVVTLALLAGLGWRPTLAEESAGLLVSTSGEVEARSAATGVWRPASAGQPLFPGDRIRTGENGRAAVLLADETLMRLNHNSHLLLKQVAPRGFWAKATGVIKAALKTVTSVYRLEQGELWLRNNNPEADIDIETPTVVASIRGTELDLKVERDRTVYMTILEGRLQARNALGAVAAGPGEQLVAEPGKAPRKVVVVSPKDAVQWTLRIPRLFPVRDLVQPPPAPLPPAKERSLRGLLETAVSALNAGSWSAAASDIEQARRVFPDDPRVRLLRGIFDLYRSNIRAARSQLTALLTDYPEYAPAWQAAALAQLLADDKEAARRAAQRALELNPDSAGGWIVAGYIDQSFFDLEAARTAFDRALALDPGNVTALINKARLLFGSDRIEAARSLLAQAEAIAPEDPGVQSLRGFLLLAKRQVPEAIAAFRRALELDPSQADAYMGLGIAYMRQGHTEEAFTSISSAVLLDPQRSLFLSYWGKMLYQVGRLERAQTVLSSAARADPQDPTPLYYHAIILRDLNRPGEAIRILNQAIALNNNRAVYRSRFLLDRDLAVRNVDQSILYSQLGLNAWAENRALASIKKDYLNFAAHIFYAGALSKREGRTRPFTTEALLGRLLQPANVNTFNTFNDYTVFFEEPSAQGVLTLAAGNHDTKLGELLGFGAAPEYNLAASVIGTYDTTDGWRNTNGRTAKGSAGLVKWQPTLKDNLTFSVRYLDDKIKDDVFGRYEYDQPGDPLDRNKSQTLTTELGYHRHFAPGSDLLAVASVLSGDSDFSDHSRFPVELAEDFFAEVDVLGTGNTDPDYKQAQLQYLHRIRDHQMLLGGIYYSGSKAADVVTEYTLFFDDLEIPIPELTDHIDNKKDIRFYNLYVQDNWTLSPSWAMEAALYWEEMRNANAFTDTQWSIDGLNPRLGLIWTPTERDTFRLAAFRYLIPFVFTRLDPADVAGVPIYRNSGEGAEVKEADLVWERSWSDGFLSTNLFYLTRDHTEVFPSEDGDVKRNFGANSGGFEAALDQLLSERIGLTGRYRFLQVDDQLQEDAKRKEHLLAAGLRYVDPSGFSAGVGETLRFIDFDNRPHNESIAITDLDLAYELPKKRGRISLQVGNLFDQQFNWVTDRFVFIGRAPEREILGTLSLNF